MEQTLGAWVAPVLMIPGMALLVISTANRYSQLLLRLENREGSAIMVQQLRSLRRALVALYAGIAAQAVAGLLGGLFAFDDGIAGPVMLVLSCVGVACLLAASLFLTVDVLRDPLGGD